jgi:hypothetical protein
MAEALEFEKADEYGNPVKRPAVRPPGKLRQAKKQRVATTATAASSDEDDCDYVAQGSQELESESSSNSGSDLSDILPSNAEVVDCFIILSSHSF